jgi:hypothetical protein
MEPATTSQLTGPSIRARVAPVYWEPLPGSGERICAILLVQPDIDSSTLLTPAAHIIIGARRLRAMLGSERGNSVFGILQAAADFMSHQLLAGAAPEECRPFFKQFEVGTERLVRAFTVEQTFDTAVRLVSAFGSAEELSDEGAVEQNNHSTVTTREFLARVQTAFSPADDERRSRFQRKVTAGTGQITIDYVHQKYLVQFASAPIGERQSQNMRREAEAKLFETLTVSKQVMGEKNSSGRLFINTAPLHTGGLADDVRKVAQDAVAHYLNIASLHGFPTCEVATHDEAVQALQALG